LNAYVFLMRLLQTPEVAEMSKSDVLTFSPLIIEIMCIELGLIVAALAMALAVQTRKRDLV
jgi:hypothetical protein